MLPLELFTSFSNLLEFAGFVYMTKQDVTVQMNFIISVFYLH